MANARGRHTPTTPDPAMNECSGELALLELLPEPARPCIGRNFLVRPGIRVRRMLPGGGLPQATMCWPPPASPRDPLPSGHWQSVTIVNSTVPSCGDHDISQLSHISLVSTPRFIAPHAPIASLSPQHRYRHYTNKYRSTKVHAKQSSPHAISSS